MKNKKLKLNKKILIYVFIIVIIILTFVYARIINIYIKNKKFEKDAIFITEKNEDKVFSLEKIILISSANAIDNSKEKNLKDLSLYQFTDMALIIDNGEELSNKNTVKSLSTQELKKEFKA